MNVSMDQVSLFCHKTAVIFKFLHLFFSEFLCLLDIAYILMIEQFTQLFDAPDVYISVTYNNKREKKKRV